MKSKAADVDKTAGWVIAVRIITDTGCFVGCAGQSRQDCEHKKCAYAARYAANHARVASPGLGFADRRIACIPIYRCMAHG
jgi:hypothetical protein